MNKNLPIIIGVLILVGVVGAFLAISGRKTSTPVTQIQTATAAPVQTQTSTQPKSLKDLLSFSKPQTCSFSNDLKNSGNVFITSGKMRGDFTSEADGKEIKSHIIVDNQTSYFWMEGQNTGYKISVEKLSQNSTATQSSNTRTQSQNQVDINKQNNYNCKDWTVDQSVFNIPTEIKFTDFSSFIPTGKSNTTGGTQNTKNPQCAACDSLSGYAQTQCKTALKCN